MKKYLFLLLIAVFVCKNIDAQPRMEEVVTVLNKNNVESLVKYFDNMVDITLNNSQTTYSKTQAEMVIKNFFVKNAVSAFSVKYKGHDADDNSFYLIGDMKTKGHGNFRVYLFFKFKDNDHFLQEMKIEQ